MTQQGRAAEGKECSGRSPPSLGSGAIGNMAIVIALFFFARTVSASGVWYAFPWLLDVALDSNDDREAGGSVHVARIFPLNLRAATGCWGECGCSVIGKKHAAPGHRGVDKCQLRRPLHTRHVTFGLKPPSWYACVACEWLARSVA